MMRKMRWFGVVLSVALLLTGCNFMDNALIKILDAPPRMEEEKFSHMTYERPDMDALKTLLEDTCELARTDTDVEKVMSGVHDYYNACDWFNTMYILADIHYSVDLTNKEYQQEYEYCSQQTSTVYGSIETLYAALAQSPILDELESEDYFGAGFFDDYKAPEGSGEDWEYESSWSENYTRLYDREQELLGDYYAAQESLSGTGSTNDYAAQKDKMGPILVELIKVRQDMAKELGYDSYEACATELIYSREKTPEEISQYARLIKTHLVPIYEQTLADEDWQRIFSSRVTPTECLSYVRSSAENMKGVVHGAFEVMQWRELYDIAASSKKAEGSFEVYLTSYAAPFVVVNPVGDLSDYLTVAHEFGHFVNDYASGGTYASADVSEIMSQSMEYLSLCYSSVLEPEQLEDLRKVSMMSSLSTYVEQMANYCFEHEIYALSQDELSVDRLCEIYDEVAQDFGYAPERTDTAEWVAVPHYFLQPFYVYSYVESNDAAMQLYEMELEEKGAGLKVYSRLVHEWENLPIGDYMERYQLTDPASPDRVEALADLFQQELGQSVDRAA